MLVARGWGFVDFLGWGFCAGWGRALPGCGFLGCGFLGCGFLGWDFLDCGFPC